MDLRPCECGESTFDRDTAIIDLGGDALGSRYEGHCPGCGARREFVFRLPAQVILPPAGQVVYGDGTPSELLDPGEWLWVADRFAGSVPAETSGLDEDVRREARVRLAAAAAAMDEALAWVPPGADAIPADAVRSELGLAVYEDEPDRFALDRLEIVRDAYRELLERVEAAR
ncbi:hypothetical protein SAMN05443668_107292 [Cryptosporangium aurantiacum]|uniref:Uncharacterized protein n=2 Tax=Cryptosporangium aurantiacum TaxID=134849 RepID=A0A1M7TXJ4_9ACTN|nr:hypothetical protein SAMN05443668_107292 [Cryptosporangium aurantiacum]